MIGVVEDVRHEGPEVAPGNEMYFPLRQYSWASSVDLLVRTRLPASAVTADLRHALHAVDPTLPVTMVRPLTALVDRTLSSRRLELELTTGFAVLALGLAVLGLYGLISCTVAQQMREIGIRMALGADPEKVQRTIVVRTVKLSLCGLAVGVISAMTTGRLMRSFLFGVSAADPVVYGATIVAMLVCAVVAGWLPARRAARVDVANLLRTE